MMEINLIPTCGTTVNFISEYDLTDGNNSKTEETEKGD